MPELADLLSRYFPGLSAGQVQKFMALEPLVASWNSRINVISRKDIEQLAVHHILHSLSIARFTSFAAGSRVIDIGTGGGFPGIPLAIFFPAVHFHLVDSIGKKISVVTEIAKELELKNVQATKIRAEELREEADFTVSRAVSILPDLVRWSVPLISKRNQNALPNGLICLKGGDLKEEIDAVKRPVTTVYLSTWFTESFFETKKLLFVPL